MSGFFASFRTCVIGVLVALLCGIGEVRADELARLFAQILRDPHNVELNIEYARLALAKGDNGKALAAYERALVADPGNRTAAAALRKLRIGLIPVVTTGRIEVGGRAETNVRQQPSTLNPWNDVVGFARLSVRDRRPLFDNDWQSEFFGYADIHKKSSEIDYWFARGHSGPVFEISGDTTVQIAPGGSVSFLDGDWYYIEPALRVTFANLFGGLLSRLDIRGGYRDINNAVGATKGLSLDVIGRNTNRGVVFDSDLVVVQPFFRWRQSDAGLAGTPVLLNTFVLGDYIEAGAQVLYYIQPTDYLRIGGKFLAYYRDYEQTIRLGTARRRDWFISPGAEIMLRNLGCTGCDIKLDYRFEQNFSNDNTEDFVNHVMSVSALKRF